MIKKIIIGTIFVIFFNGCVQNTAFLTPILTGATTGSINNAGFSYGSNKVITTLTGKSTKENIKELLIPKKEDDDFTKLVKRRIKETRKKLKLSQ
jgi:hypothetical protein|tara:strand:- start:80 stop:364 length:285 start_codon:yes stop_codon:yes gene_type:complete